MWVFATSAKRRSLTFSYINFDKIYKHCSEHNSWFRISVWFFHIGYTNGSNKIIQNYSKISLIFQNNCSLSDFFISISLFTSGSNDPRHLNRARTCPENHKFWKLILFAMIFKFKIMLCWLCNFQIFKKLTL